MALSASAEDAVAGVSLSQINKHYGSLLALSDVSLNVADGEFTVFVGPSGCGKSTLLRSIAGLERISSGTIRIGDTDVTSASPADRDLAMVFQTYALYPHMTVRQNMEFGMKVNGFSKALQAERIAEAARVLQLGDYLERKPAQLSGGQRQRVAIGRAIVKQPALFLFDEPLSNLDAKLRVQMRLELESLHRELGATMIYVTHDQVEAMTMADRIVVLNNGRIEQIGTPMDLYHRPQSEFVADFIGAPSMNFLNVTAEGSALRFCDCAIDNPSEYAGVQRIGIRPEHVQIVDSAQTGGLRVQVQTRETLGGEAYLYTDHAESDTRIVVRTDGDDTQRVGDSLILVLPAKRLHYFDAQRQSLGAQVA